MGCCKASTLSRGVYEPQGPVCVEVGAEHVAEKPCWPVSPRAFYGEGADSQPAEETGNPSSCSSLLSAELNGSKSSCNVHNGACLRFISATTEDPLDFQHTPSGDSFVTCISQESAMQRYRQSLAATEAQLKGGPTMPRVRFASGDSKGSTSGEWRSPSSTVVSGCSSARLSTICSSLEGREDEVEHSPIADVCHAEMQAPTAPAEAYTGMPVDSAATGGRSLAGRRSVSKSISHARKSVLRRLSRRNGAGSKEEPGCARRKSVIPGYFANRQNPNMPSEYSWTAELLEMIIQNQTSGVGSLDRASPHAQVTSPLFVVCGACPSSFAPMQAILYSAVGSGVSVDFWWTKPLKADPSGLERQTLDRWGKGPHKNEPGRSKPIYKPLGDLFSGSAGKVKQEFRFGLESVATTLRAFIEDPREELAARYYLYFVWQEEWTSNPFSSDKFIKGKIAYQRQPLQGLQAAVYLREYCIQNGIMRLADVEEETFPNTVLPNSACKELGALKAHK